MLLFMCGINRELSRIMSVDEFGMTKDDILLVENTEVIE